MKDDAKDDVGSHAGACGDRGIYDFYLTKLEYDFSGTVADGEGVEQVLQKRVSESRSAMTDLVLPFDANVYGTIFGGRVMAYVDKIASITAMRHCRMPVVTVSTDSFDFLAPIRVGEAIQLEAFVTWTHHTSMEIFCRIECEDLLTGKRTLTGTSYLTFVALGSDGRATPVPSIIPETAEEQWHFDTAPQRREIRLRHREERQQSERDRASGN